MQVESMGLDRKTLDQINAKAIHLIRIHVIFFFYWWDKITCCINLKKLHRNNMSCNHSMHCFPGALYKAMILELIQSLIYHCDDLSDNAIITLFPDQ